MKYLIFFRNHSSYVKCRKVNKLWFLGTFHTIILVFQYHPSFRITLFPDSVMFEDELGTPEWSWWQNIWIFEEITLITAHMCTVEEWTNYGSGDIAWHYFSIPLWSLMQKYIISWLTDVWRWGKHTGVKIVTKYLYFFANHRAYM